MFRFRTLPVFHMVHLQTEDEGQSLVILKDLLDPQFRHRQMIFILL